MDIVTVFGVRSAMHKQYLHILTDVLAIDLERFFVSMWNVPSPVHQRLGFPVKMLRDCCEQLRRALSSEFALPL